MGSYCAGVAMVAGIDELLGPLDADRQLHCLAVGKKAASAVRLVAEELRLDVVTAATVDQVRS
jgi:hypothetical protein